MRHPELARRAVALLCVIATTVVVGPAQAWASPPESGAPAADTGPSSAVEMEGESDGTNEGAIEETSAAPSDDGPEAGSPTDASDADPEYEVERPDRSSVGIGGNVLDADDPDVTAAQDQLEGGKLDAPVASSTPTRLQPMQAAAWWTMFGAVALGTVGGTFAGLAEREEDRAGRLARSFDFEAGQRETYADVASEYEQTIDRGEAFAWTSRGFLIAGGVALTASIALFAVHARRDRARGRTAGRARNAQLRRAGPGGLEIAF